MTRFLISVIIRIIKGIYKSLLNCNYMALYN